MLGNGAVQKRGALREESSTAHLRWAGEGAATVGVRTFLGLRGPCSPAFSVRPTRPGWGESSDRGAQWQAGLCDGGLSVTVPRSPSIETPGLGDKTAIGASR